MTDTIGMLYQDRLREARAEIARLNSALASAEAKGFAAKDALTDAEHLIACMLSPHEDTSPTLEKVRAAIRALQPPAAPAEMPCSVTVEDNDGRGFLMSSFRAGRGAERGE